MDKPILTVVMLVYNKAGFLPDAIESVLGQKCQYKYKLLISDDCSSDNSLAIARSYQKRFPDKIDIIEHKTNCGVIRNSIDAYESICTKYISICDADDFYCSRDKLQRQITYMEKHPECSISFHKALNYYVKTGVKTLSNPNQKKVLTIKDMAVSNYISSCTVMYRNYINGKLPEWYADVTTNDLPLNLIMANEGDIHFIPSVMSVYRKEYGNSEFAGATEITRLRNTLYSRYPLLNDPRWSEEVRMLMKETCAIYLYRLIDLYQKAGDMTNVELHKEHLDQLELSEEQLASAYQKANVPPVLIQYKGWKKAASCLSRRLSRLIPVSILKIKVS